MGDVQGAYRHMGSVQMYRGMYRCMGGGQMYREHTDVWRDVQMSISSYYDFV